MTRVLDRADPHRGRAEPPVAEPATPPRTRADAVLALQRTRGNGAASRAVEQLRPRGGRRLARLTITVAMTGTGKHDTINSVTYDTSRTPGNISGHQGDHTTGFLTFKSMVRNNVMGKTISQAKTALLGLLDEVMLFPGAAIKVSNTEYLFKKADEVQGEIAKVADKDDLEAAMVKLVEIRNTLGLSARLNSTSTGGHGEAGNNALIQECDDRLRRGGPALRYTSEQIIDAMWALLDYHPKDSEDDDRIVATVAQHIYSLRATYPHIFTSAGDNGLVPGVNTGDLRGYFSDELIKALRKTPGLVFDNIDKNKRINALVRAVEQASLHGVKVLAPVGASKRYAQHLASH
jgi:hypothetical protein